MPDLRPGDAAPLHHQMKEAFARQIRSGTWRHEQPLPAEDAICRHYGMSRGTVRRAIEQLVQEGLVYRKQGRGTFVSRPSLQGSILASYKDYMADGIQHDAGAEVLRCERCLPDSDIRSILQLDPGAEVYVLERVRFVGSIRISLQISYLPAEYCPGLETKNLSGMHLYDVLQQEFDVCFVRAEEYVEPIVVGERVANELGISAGDPAFYVERKSYTFFGKIAEYRRATMRGDVFKYRIDLR